MTNNEIAIAIAKQVHDKNISSGFVVDLTIMDCIRKFNIQPLSIVGQEITKQVEKNLQELAR